MEQKIIRCAVYTRKSTEEGLDKEFNTLEAQREAGENYIKSQKNLGWVLIPEYYDDGGYSGGTLKRPALQRLLSDVQDGKVDMIVVYKIDRLTRSLLDFSQLIKTLDAHECSFVSVTQNFNTCDSMGKLTLNILLSFAQFEREVSAERIRDKIAATKKKGMWTGGSVPLGYDVEKKKLIINKEEAKIVRYIFEEYLRCRSEIQVSRNANEMGYHSKPRKVRNSSGEVALSFNHAMINNMLRNPIYIGKVPYKGELFDGLHEAIIPMELWNQVQELKRLNRGDRFAPSRSFKNSLLKGLVECECCGTMTPTRCKKGNKYYEYYTSLRAVKEGYPIGTVPSGGLFLTAGVDIQKDRIECEVVAWGRQKQSWSVEYFVLDGDTAKPDVWRQLQNVLHKDYPHESGITMPIRVMCVDSGYATQDVYNFVKNFNQAVWGGSGARASQPHTVVAIKGQSRDTAMLLSTSKADTKKKGLKVWNVSGPVVKTELYRWLKMERIGENATDFGRCHFPQYSEEYFKQLTAERQVVKISNGYPKPVWEKDPARRNEALDCRVYARAGAAIYGLDRLSEKAWQELEAVIPAKSSAVPVQKKKRFIQMQPTKVDNPWL